jgi:hypothetical protein
MRGWLVALAIVSAGLTAGCGNSGPTCSCRARDCDNQLSTHFAPVAGATAARMCLDLGFCADFTLDMSACAIDPAYADGGACVVEPDGRVLITMLFQAVPNGNDAHGVTLSQIDMNDAVINEATTSFYFNPDYLCRPSGCGSTHDVCYAYTAEL